MGPIQILLCAFLGRFIAAHSIRRYQDATFPQDFEGFFGNFMPLPFERNLDFTPFDFLSSWQTWTPDFHMFPELPPMLIIPRVQVFCDGSKLSVLVDKRTNGLILNVEEIQLGDGCYRNGELPNQYVFTYSFDQCGNLHEIQKGVERLTNSIRLNLKKTLPTWWQIPSTIPISCTPNRFYGNPEFSGLTPPSNGKRFNIDVMDQSWTSLANSAVYERGQVINLQVSGRIEPNQQLFIQSCFVAASPEHQSRPRHSVILNKGCAAPHNTAQFTASNMKDVVNFAVNTSYLISELYIHCHVLISDQGVTFASKSCNYNRNKSRWEELSGAIEVCDCCSSKCEGPSVKTFPADSKHMVSTGLLVIEDGDRVDAENPTTRLTLLGQVPDAEHNTVSQSEDGLIVQVPLDNGVLNNVPELYPSATDQESYLLTNNIESDHTGDAPLWDLNLLTLVSGWPVLPRPENAVIAEEFQRNRFARSAKFGPEATQLDVSLPTEIGVNYLILVDGPNSPELDAASIEEESQKKRWLPSEMNLDDKNECKRIRDEFATMQMDEAAMPEKGTTDVQPIIRSKVEFSKNVDGSQKLSYEEVKQQEGNGVIGRHARDEIKRKREPRLKGLRSTFLHLLRRMEQTE